jgi:hypothetical protein
MILALLAACAHDGADDSSVRHSRRGWVDAEPPDTTGSEPEPPRVTFVSPGASASNPVVFVVDASDDVDVVQLSWGAEGSDDRWDIGSVDPGAPFTYEFTTTGDAKVVRAVGLSDGEPVAEAETTVSVQDGSDDPETSSTVFADLVLSVVATYPTDGSYGYYWPDDDGTWWGTPRGVTYDGTEMSPGDDEQRSYCSGLTWEVFMRAAVAAERLADGDGRTIGGLTVSQMERFREDWFVLDVPEDGPSWRGPADALEAYGLGEQEECDFADWPPCPDAVAGDFVQLWRSQETSGHTNVFVSWVDEPRHGYRYWSSQGSTDGVGYHTEYFGEDDWDLDEAHFSVAHTYMPEER